jgi:hypothetical protein
MIRKKLISQLGSPNYRAQLITNWQSTEDIVSAIKSQHVKNRSEAKAICKHFDRGNEKDTAKAIFNFLKTETQYVREHPSQQTTKSIKRFLADGKGDCKHYSLFINNILEACGYNPVYRFAGYSREGYTHVYSYLPKTDTVIDAVLPSFDTEKTPTIQKDMSLYSLSGFEPEENQQITGVNFSKITSNLKKASTKASNVVQKAVKELPKATQKLAATTKTVSIAPARLAFISLVKLNGLGLASNLNELLTKSGKPSLSFWEKLGGKTDELVKAIQSGATKKAILGGVDEESAARAEIFDGYDANGVDTMGAVGLAATVATATPILLQVKATLEKAGIRPSKVAALKEKVKSGAEGFKKMTGRSVTDVIFKKDKGGESSANSTYSATDLENTTTADAEKVVKASIAQATGTDLQTIEEIKNSTSLIATVLPPEPKDRPKPVITNAPVDFPKVSQKVILIGAAVVAGYFLLRKK